MGSKRSTIDRSLGAQTPIVCIRTRYELETHLQRTCLRERQQRLQLALSLQRQGMFLWALRAEELRCIVVRQSDGHAGYAYRVAAHNAGDLPDAEGSENEDFFKWLAASTAAA